MSRKYAVCATLIALYLGIALAQSKDLLVGKWELNRGKSDFQPETTIRSRTLTVEAAGSGIKVVQDTVVLDGHTVQVEYTAGYDGKDAPISSSLLDTVALKRVNANTVERTGKIRGQATESATMAISADGKVLTISTKGTADGVEYNSTQVFERQ